MCGIAGIALKKYGELSVPQTLRAMCASLAHRGPDGEGFLIRYPEQLSCFAGDAFDTYSSSEIPYLPEHKISEASSAGALFGFGHRRLSIIDLSRLGHQPMSCTDKDTWITFNGEIYNYRELRRELELEGSVFVSDCDTEVVIRAYLKWGEDCVHRFNGMWSFCIYDAVRQILFASRDRFGVKPFYYINNERFFCFASEQKAFIKAGLLRAGVSAQNLHGYLVNSRVEHTENNFFEGVTELWPGHNLVYSFHDQRAHTSRWYTLKETQDNEGLSDTGLISLIREKLHNAIRLRLRSDVQVGACLSGGIDSSAICGWMSKELGGGFPVFTSVFPSETFNEEKFAVRAAEYNGAVHFKCEPDYDSFLKDLDALIYSQDVPIWDTSTYSQYSVFSLAKQQGIKVVIDGQGADELFAGYHHHLLALWNETRQSEGTLAWMKALASAKSSLHSPFQFFLKESVKQRYHPQSGLYRKVFKKEFLALATLEPAQRIHPTVNDQLRDDIEQSRLKSFLKCEDRCGMWHSVESRTPFSDDRDLISLAFSFRGARKIKDGVLKHLLREAAREILPPEIYRRKDKRGFETPMTRWMEQMRPAALSEISAAGFDFVNLKAAENLNPSDLQEARLMFRLLVLSRWRKNFSLSA